jgi:hypothetical protein
MGGQSRWGESDQPPYLSHLPYPPYSSGRKKREP